MSAMKTASLAGATAAVRAEATSLSPLLRFRNIFGALGIILAIAAVIMGISSGAALFFEAYLYSFVFWTGASLGAFLMLTVVHMAGGSWGALIRKPLEAAIAVLPLMAVLLIPIFFGMNSLYLWTDAEYVAGSALVGAKSALLNTPFFIIRNIAYFGIWILGAFLFLRGSARQDEDETGKVAFRLRRMGPGWLAIYVMTMTFAAIDWTMSLTPEWFSGIYPTILMSGQAVFAVALMIIVMSALARISPTIDRLLTEKRLQDLGNFLMAFSMFWAYVSISQLIIIWSNNTMETSAYYVARITGTWEPVAIFLTVFGFFGPFAILFSRWVKRKRGALVIVAIWMILVRMLDLYWIVIPSYGRVGSEFQWLDVIMILGMGGLWLAVFLHQLAKRPLIPARDPRLQEALHGH